MQTSDTPRGPLDELLDAMERAGAFDVPNPMDDYDPIGGVINLPPKAAGRAVRGGWEFGPMLRLVT